MRFGSLEGAEMNFEPNLGRYQMSHYIGNDDFSKQRYINDLNRIFLLVTNKRMDFLKKPAEAKVFDTLLLGYVYTGLVYEKFSLKDSENFKKILGFINEGMPFMLSSGTRMDDSEMTKFILRHIILKNSSYPCNLSQNLINDTIVAKFIFKQLKNNQMEIIFDDLSLDAAKFYLVKCNEEIQGPFDMDLDGIFSSRLWMASFIFQKSNEDRKEIPKYVYKELLNGYSKAGKFKEYDNVMRSMLWARFKSVEFSEKFTYIMAYIRSFPLSYVCFLICTINFYISGYIQVKKMEENSITLLKWMKLATMCASKSSIRQMQGKSTDVFIIIAYTFFVTGFTLFFSESDKTLQLIMNSL